MRVVMMTVTTNRRESVAIIRGDGDGTRGYDDGIGYRTADVVEKELAFWVERCDEPMTLWCWQFVQLENADQLEESAVTNGVARSGDREEGLVLFADDRDEEDG